MQELPEGNEMQLLLDILYDNILGDGEADENAPIVNDEGNVPIVNEAGDNIGNDDNDDFEANMIFEGDDYSVNFHRHINVQNVRDLGFDGGAARETVPRCALHKAASQTDEGVGIQSALAARYDKTTKNQNGAE